MAKKNVYLVAYYVCKPRHKHVKTTVKGWMDNPDNISWDEQINITVNLKNRDLTTSKVILDLSNKTVHKNTWNNNKSFDEFFNHFYEGYQKYLDPVIEQLGYNLTKEEVVNTNQLVKNETISSE